MNPEEQIKALAELDGCSEPWLHMNGLWNYTNSDGKTILVRPYLTSYDAIIPVIQKLKLSSVGWFDLQRSTPSQLCEALLRTTGKWKD